MTHSTSFTYQLKREILSFSNKISKCLSKRVSASVSPPGHTAEDRPSVSKPKEKEPNKWRKENIINIVIINIIANKILVLVK